MSRTIRHAHADTEPREVRKPVRRQGTRAQVIDAVLAEYGTLRSAVLQEATR